MKRQLIYLILLVTVLIGLLPGTTSAQETTASTIGLPAVADRTTLDQPAPQPTTAAASSEGRRIEITPMSVLLAPAQGYKYTWIEATVYDDGGGGTVTWAVSDPSVIELEPDGNRAQLIALTEIGSATVTATYNDLHQSASVIVARLGSNTRMIDHSLVRYDLNQPGIVFLTQTAETQAIQPDDILVSDPVRLDQPGLGVHVLSVEISNKLVAVAYKPAALAEAYDDFHASYTGDALEVPLNTATAAGGTANSSSSLDCESSGPIGSLNVTMAEVAGTLRILPQITIDISSSRLTRFSTVFDTVADVTVSGPTITIEASGTVAMECKVELGKLSLPPIFISFLTLTPKLKSELGMRGAIDMSFGQLKFSTIGLQYQATGRYGVEYTPETSWIKIATTASDGPRIKWPERSGKPHVDFKARVNPFLGVDLSVGVGVFGQDIVDVKFMRCEFGIVGELTVPLDALLYGPTPPSPDYANPSWKIEAGISLSLSFGLDWGDLVKLITNERLGWPEFNFTLVSFTAQLAASPGFGLTATPDTANAYTVTVSPSGPFGLGEQLAYMGKPVELWAMPQGASPWFLDTGALDSDGRTTFHRVRPAGQPVCQGIQFPLPYPYTPVPCNVNAVGHYYAIRASAGPGVYGAAVAVQLFDPHVSGPLAQVWLGDHGGDCTGYPDVHAGQRNVTPVLTVNVSDAKRLAGTIDVEDLGTTLDGYIVALVHDRILDLFSLATMTVIIPAPPRGIVCR